MSEGPFPKTIKEALPWITWGAIIFTFFLVFVEKLVEGAYGQALSALIGGGLVTAMALHSKTWLEKTNPNWAFAAALALLFAIISEPWIEQKKWPFTSWFQDSAAAEARGSTLTEWLQQAQHERDEARQELEQAKTSFESQAQHDRDEAKQAEAAAEAQKTTLVEWLKIAQRENKTPGMITYDVRPHRAATAAEECLSLAQRLADLDPGWANQKVEIEHLRSTMTALGCGCDGLKK